jgi:hypothetical protein
MSKGDLDAPHDHPPSFGRRLLEGPVTIAAPKEQGDKTKFTGHPIRWPVEGLVGLLQSFRALGF